MGRHYMVAVHALGLVLVASLARAQPLPLPLPPLPPPSFSVAPDTAASTPPRQVSTRCETVQASLGDSSTAARKALRRSGEHESWYGWQTLTVDASAVGILLVGAALVTARPPMLSATTAPRPIPFAVASLGVYAIGSPVVHVAHGEYRHGLASLLLRIAASLAGFGLGYLAGKATPARSEGAWTGGAYGSALGGIGAIAVDASGLAWHRWHTSAGPTALFSTSGSF